MKVSERVGGVDRPERSEIAQNQETVAEFFFPHSLDSQGVLDPLRASLPDLLHLPKHLSEVM